MKFKILIMALLVLGTVSVTSAIHPATIPGSHGYVTKNKTWRIPFVGKVHKIKHYGWGTPHQAPPAVVPLQPQPLQPPTIAPPVSYQLMQPRVPTLRPATMPPPPRAGRYVWQDGEERAQFEPYVRIPESQYRGMQATIQQQRGVIQQQYQQQPPVLKPSNDGRVSPFAEDDG